MWTVLAQAKLPCYTGNETDVWFDANKILVKFW
jgi:hypothetical protein